jgi:hypothetical protein
VRHAIANVRGSLPALVTVVLLLATGLAHDVQAQSGAADANPPFDDQLHAGMLELRRLERMNDRAGAIRVGEQLLREYPDHPRVEEALMHLYRLERRDQQLIALLARRVERNAASPEILREARELGTYLLAHKRQSEALAMMQRVIAASPRG